MIHRRALSTVINVVLQELVPGLGVTHAAQDSQHGIIQVTNRMADISGLGFGVDLPQRLEEMNGNVGV